MSRGSASGLPNETILHLQPDVSLQIRDKHSIALCTAGALHAFEGEDAATVSAFVRALDGSASLSAVALKTRLPPDEVQAAALALYGAGLVAEDTDVPIDPLVFYDHARAAALLWGQTALTAPTEGPGESERVRSSVVLGQLIEHWHYVRTAPARLAAAACIARLACARELWLNLAVEEDMWARELESGLRQVVGRGELRRAHPLPCTESLCAQMEAAARVHQLGYAACVAAGLGSEESNAGLLAYYRRLEKPGVLPTSVLTPFLRYAERAAELSHSDPVRVIFAVQQPLRLADRRIVLAELSKHLQALAAFHRAVAEFYSAHEQSRLFVPLADQGSGRNSRGPLRKVGELWRTFRTSRQGSGRSSSKASG